MKRLALLALAVLAAAAQAAPPAILFVGNSYTFGRVDPVMSYNNANVDDMTRPRPDLPDPNFTETAGTRAWEPHPWGGVPGIFTQLADQAGVEFDVSMSTRNAASLRGHFLNTANADWDLRGNIAKRKWDIVVLQEQSDAALPVGKGANANPLVFSAYADKIEQFIHVGTAHTYRERDHLRRNQRGVRGADGVYDRHLRHAAHDPGKPERQCPHQGVPDTDLGAPGHGVPPSRDDRRRQLPHRARRAPDRRHDEPRIPERLSRHALLRGGRARRHDGRPQRRFCIEGIGKMRASPA